jgi:hypothetical protein
MTVAKGFVTGFVVILVLEFIAFMALGMAAQAQAWPGSRLALGPLVIFESQRLDNGYATTFGAGIVVVAALAGVLNGLGAALLTRNEARRPGRAD